MRQKEKVDRLCDLQWTKQISDVAQITSNTGKHCNEREKMRIQLFPSKNDSNHILITRQFLQMRESSKLRVAAATKTPLAANLK